MKVGGSNRNRTCTPLFTKQPLCLRAIEPETMAASLTEKRPKPGGRTHPTLFRFHEPTAKRSEARTLTEILA